MALPNRSNISSADTSDRIAPASVADAMPSFAHLLSVDEASAGSELHRIRNVRDILSEARRRFDATNGPQAMRARFLDHLAHADAELLRLYRFERFGPARARYDDLISSETNGTRRIYIDLDSNG